LKIQMIKRTILSILILFSVSQLFSQSHGGGSYGVVQLNGTVNPVNCEYVMESIKASERNSHKFIILQLDTPGGLMSSMRDLIKTILTSEIPVVVYTFPKGAQAASAGGFIMLSGHVNAMAPGTEIGAMHPVSPMLDFMKKDRKGDPSGIMEKKVLNDTVAYAKSLAQKRKRNVKWAERAVKKAISNSYSEAKKLKVVDIIAEDMDDLLQKLNNRKIYLNGRAFTFKTAGLKPYVYEMPWKQGLVNRLADPQLIFLLFIVAIAGIVMEFKNPGLIIPGAVGGISMILFLLGIKIIPINALGLLLIVLAFVLFFMELYIVSYGMLTVGGILSFVFGAMILFDSPLQGGGLPISTIVAMVLVVLAFVFIIIRAAVNIMKTKVTTGKSGLIGAEAVALADFSERGQVRVHGEIWNVEFEGDVRKGDIFIVDEVRGLTLKIKKK